MSSKHRHPAILVAAARDGFRRGGHEFGTRPKTLALGALSADQHAAIVDDKSLVVVKTAVALEPHEVEALPHREAPHVMEAMANAHSLTLDVSDADAKRTLDLDGREKELAERAAALADIEADLKEREQVVAAGEASLAREKAEFDAAVARYENEVRAAHEQAAQASHSKTTTKK